MWYKIHRLYLKSVYSCTCVVRNLAFKERYGLLSRLQGGNL